MADSPVEAFLRDESGATAIEYGLIAALMAMTAIVAFTMFGDSLRNLFGVSENGVGAELQRAVDRM